MRIAVLAIRSLRGSGFGTRISSMVASYATAGHDVDVFHYRFDHEERLPDEIAEACTYVTVPLKGGRYRRHATLLPPLAWECRRASSPPSANGSGRYDVIQAETSNTWSVARSVPARKKVLVLHDDDAARLGTLARIASDGKHRVAAGLAARKYARWQRIALQEADRAWFVSRSELDHLARNSAREKARVVPNGAADELWTLAAPRESSGAEVLFVGPGFYEANARGLTWFLHHVWPSVRERVPGTRLRVVGLGWRGFGTHPDASFIGWSDSLVDEYRRSRLVIAPLFAGGGTKTKVVEAMAAARPVVATSSAVDAIPRSDGLRVRDEPGPFTAEICRFLFDMDAVRRAGASNRRAVDGLRWSAVWEEAGRDLESLCM